MIHHAPIKGRKRIRKKKIETERERQSYIGARWQPAGAVESPALNSLGTQKGNCFSPDVAFAQQAGYNVPTELMSPISEMIKN